MSHGTVVLYVHDLSRQVLVSKHTTCPRPETLPNVLISYLPLIVILSSRAMVGAYVESWTESSLPSLLADDITVSTGLRTSAASCP